MPRVTGPMFSLRAAGTYGGELTFATVQGRNIVRRRVDPRDPRTASQLTQRARIAEIALMWHSASATIRAQWQAAAAPLQSNGYAYFVRQCHLQDKHPPYLPSIP